MQFHQDQEPGKMTPVITGVKCHIYVYGIFFILILLPLVVGIYTGLTYNWMIAIGITLFLYIVSGIVSSKMRLSSLPAQQREQSFSTLEIAKWYVSIHLCFN
ncbi:MAG: hypothetical protein K0U47_11730 [Epsilonproteobacteria bacterium]|nr:hypothetical protein [Campylobacterota bacterium]